MANHSNLQEALAYAALGWPILPIHSPVAEGCSCGQTTCTSLGKHPRTSHGLKDATTDGTQLRTWWKQWPDSNLAIVTGTTAKLVVLDIDTHKSGETTLTQLEGQNGALPETVEQRTGGGGRHLLFHYPEDGQTIRNSAGKLGPGLDVRAEGGYIVVPPSLHCSGQHYGWVESRSPFDRQPAPLPDWLLRLLQQSSTEARGNNNGAGSIPKGERNSTLTSLAGTMWRRGMSRQAFFGGSQSGKSVSMRRTLIRRRSPTHCRIRLPLSQQREGGSSGLHPGL